MAGQNLGLPNGHGDLAALLGTGTGVAAGSDLASLLGTSAGTDLTSLLGGAGAGISAGGFLGMQPAGGVGSDLASLLGAGPVAGAGGDLTRLLGAGPGFGTGSDAASLLGTGPAFGAGGDLANLLGIGPAAGAGGNLISFMPTGPVAGGGAGSDLALLLGGAAGSGAGSDLASLLGSGSGGGATMQQPAELSMSLLQELAGALSMPTMPAPTMQPAQFTAPSGLVSTKPLKLFIGGLSQETSTATLNSYFSQFGRVSSIVMMDKATGRSRGFGFVDFVDEAAMQTALQMHQHVVDGAAVTCSAYGGKGQRSPAVLPPKPSPAASDLLGSITHNLAPAQQPAQTMSNLGIADFLGGAPSAQTPTMLAPAVIPGRLFIGGLAQTTTVASLKAAFSRYGPCETEVMIDKMTGRSRGFGFVRFRYQEEANMALAERHIVDDKAVEVSQCMAKGPPPRVPAVRASPY